MSKPSKVLPDIATVLVIGDNRLVTNILHGLASSPFAVHQAVPLNHSPSQPDTSMQLHRIDLSSEGLNTLFRSVQPDVVFSAQSGGSFEVQKRVIDAALRAHIPRFVAAEFSHDSLNETVQARLPPHRARARVIHYLRDQAARHVQSGSFSWTAVAVGVAPLEHALSSGNLGINLKWHSATVLGTGEERFAASSAAWIGRVAAAVLGRWEDVRNKYVYAAGMMLTAKEVVQALEAKTGSRYEVGYVDIEDGMREAQRRIDGGFPDTSMFLMERSVLCDPGVDAARPFLEADEKGKLKLVGESLETVIGTVLHDRAHHSKGDCGC